MSASTTSSVTVGMPNADAVHGNRGLQIHWVSTLSVDEPRGVDKRKARNASAPAAPGALSKESQRVMLPDFEPPGDRVTHEIGDSGSLSSS